MLIHCDRRANEDGAVPPEGWYQYGCYMPLDHLAGGGLSWTAPYSWLALLYCLER